MKRNDEPLSKEYYEALLDLHLTDKKVSPLMAVKLKDRKLIDKKGVITNDGVKTVHAYVENKNRRQWLDK